MPHNAPEDIVHADDALLAFISPRTWPNTTGNVLIVPRAHYENLYDMPDDLLAQVIVLAKRIAIAMKCAYGCDGTSLRQHNEPAGNQDVWHFHLHVFPRFAGDDFGISADWSVHPTRAELDANAALIRRAYARDLR